VVARQTTPVAIGAPSFAATTVVVTKQTTAGALGVVTSREGVTQTAPAAAVGASHEEVDEDEQRLVREVLRLLAAGVTDLEGIGMAVGRWQVTPLLANSFRSWISSRPEFALARVGTQWHIHSANR
jgi:hypothetical protein